MYIEAVRHLREQRLKAARGNSTQPSFDARWIMVVVQIRKDLSRGTENILHVRLIQQVCAG
jgi:hypothetical protein